MDDMEPYAPEPSSSTEPVSAVAPVAPTQPKGSWIHRRWVPWLAGALAYVLTLAVGGILAADWVWRGVEMRALLDRVEASEAVMGELQDSVTLAFDSHGSGDDQVKLDGELRDLATQAVTDIAAAGDEVAALPIALWHTDIERARDAYLLHNEAWQEYMARASESSSEFLAPQPLVNQTFFDAEQPFYNAVPLPDVFGLVDRVALIFVMPDEDGAGGGEQVLASLSRS